MKKVLLLILLAIVLIPSLALARIGVGVGTGKIYMEGSLKPGGIYTVQESVERQEDEERSATMSVINTGDEPADYEMSVAFLTGQAEMWPDKTWFSFEPNNFYLDPGKAQAVTVRITLPVNAEPGDYFAFLEARPAKKSTGQGGAQIGVAAATKLWFTVGSSNIFTAMYYRLLALFRDYKPWSQIILALIIVATLLTIIKNKFSFQLSVGKKSKEEEKEAKIKDDKSTDKDSEK